MSASKNIVLYVEDEETDRLFMQRAFVREDLQDTLRMVSDGKEALDYLSGTGSYANRETYPLPSLVLLDLNLPEIHGFEVLRWIRTHPPYKALPVVVFSSSGRNEDQGQARLLGADEFISKPASVIRFRDVAAMLKARWLAPRDAKGENTLPIGATSQVPGEFGIASARLEKPQTPPTVRN